MSQIFILFRLYMTVLYELLLNWVSRLEKSYYTFQKYFTGLRKSMMIRYTHGRGEGKTLYFSGLLLLYFEIHYYFFIFIIRACETPIQERFPRDRQVPANRTDRKTNRNMTDSFDRNYLSPKDTTRDDTIRYPCFRRTVRTGHK
jgi:hypothetical protein